MIQNDRRVFLKKIKSLKCSFFLYILKIYLIFIIRNMTTIKEFIDKKLSIKEDIISELKGFWFKVLPNLLDSRSSIDEIEEVFFKENLENKLEAKIFLSVKFPFRDKIISFFTHKKQVYTDLLGRTVTVKISEKNIKECREFKGRELSPFEYYLAPVIWLRWEIIGFNDIWTIVYIWSNDSYCSSSEDKESLNKASIKSKNYSSFSSVIWIYIRCNIRKTKYKKDRIWRSWKY